MTWLGISGLQRPNSGKTSVNLLKDQHMIQYTKKCVKFCLVINCKEQQSSFIFPVMTPRTCHIVRTVHVFMCRHFRTNLASSSVHLQEVESLKLPLDLETVFSQQLRVRVVKVPGEICRPAKFSHKDQKNGPKMIS